MSARPPPVAVFRDLRAHPGLRMGCPQGSRQAVRDGLLWVAVADLPRLPIEPPIRFWIAAAPALEDASQIA